MSLKGFVALLAILTFLAFPAVLLGSKTFFFRDFGVFSYPLAYYFRESFWRGEIPFWDPLNNAGIPFLAQWNTLVLYPPSLIYLLLPLPWSLNLFCLGHLVLAGTGAYLLARRWTGHPLAAASAGIIFAFNGFTVSALTWPAIISSLAWAPLVLLWAERAVLEGGRAVLLASLVAALQMLSGAPEVIGLTWLVASGLWVLQTAAHPGTWRLAATRFGAVLLLTTGLSAIQLLPFFQLLGLSQRDQSFGGSSWPMPPWGLANFFVPLFRYTSLGGGIFLQSGQLWIASYYLGVGALLLAAIGFSKRTPARPWLLAAVALIGVILAAGDQGWLYGFLRRHLSIFNTFRFPVKFLVLAVITVPLLAAWGVARYFPAATDAPPAATPGERNPPIWGHPIIICGAAVLLVIAGLLGLAVWFPLPLGDQGVTIRNGLVRAAFLILTVLNLLALQRRPARANLSRALEWSLLLLLWADLITHCPNQNPTAPRDVYAPRLARTTANRPLPFFGEGRIMMEPAAEQKFNTAFIAQIVEGYLATRLAFFHDCNMLDDVPKVNGAFALYLKLYQEALAMVSSPGLTNASGLAAFLGITHTTAPGTFYEWIEVSRRGKLVAGGQQPVFLPAVGTLPVLGAADFAPAEVVLLPKEAETEATAKEKAAMKIAQEKYSPHRVEFEVAADRPGWVTIAQAFYPAWRARVDGRPVKLWRANHAFQALEVPAGSHRVEVQYVDRRFQIGLGISLVTLLLWLGLLALRLPKKIPPHPGPTAV